MKKILFVLGLFLAFCGNAWAAAAPITVEVKGVVNDITYLGGGMPWPLTAPTVGGPFTYRFSYDPTVGVLIGQTNLLNSPLSNSSISFGPDSYTFSDHRGYLDFAYRDYPTTADIEFFSGVSCSGGVTAGGSLLGASLDYPYEPFTMPRLLTGIIGVFSVHVQASNCFPASIVSAYITSITSTPAAIPVSIRVQNTINLSSNGLTQVAILGSPTFDASQVDASTVVFAGAAPRLVHTRYSCRLADVNVDGLQDLQCSISNSQLELQTSDTTATLTAKTYSGQDVIGHIAVKVISK